MAARHAHLWAWHVLANAQHLSKWHKNVSCGLHDAYVLGASFSAGATKQTMQIIDNREIHQAKEGVQPAVDLDRRCKKLWTNMLDCQLGHLNHWAWKKWSVRRKAGKTWQCSQKISTLTGPILSYTQTFTSYIHVVHLFHCIPITASNTCNMWTVREVQ